MNNVFIIAEAGVNHNGDIILARRLVDAAVQAGVDAVKFQTWKTELLVTKDAKQAVYQSDNTGIVESQFDMLKRLELSYANFRDLKTYCDASNIVFMSTPDEIESADFLTGLQSIFKIGSGELTNLPFLRHVGKLNKEIILSTGMGDLGEIEDALNVLISAGTAKERITVLHATTEYPCPIAEVNLNAMNSIRNAFQIRVGYSDHTKGIEIPIAAVAMGACVIEKHFTLDRNLPGPDHKASLEPDELKAMVRAIRNIEVALGDGVKHVTQSEARNKSVARKSLVASQVIRAGESFGVNNIVAKRPGTGISPMRWDEVMGLYARRDFAVDELIEL
jgi:N-acetylneuraminate synthase